MFTPAVSSDATEGRLDVVKGLSLVRHARGDGGGGAPRVPVGAATGTSTQAAIVLGTLDGAPCFARQLGDGDAAPPGSEPVPLRQLFGALSEDEFAIAGRALGLDAWDRDHRYCGRCGARDRALDDRAPAHVHALRPRRAIRGSRRRSSCSSSATAARCSPATRATPLPFYSTLAGFVEVGETLEEMRRARSARRSRHRDRATSRYFGSQPWPFTGSLMIGFTANWAEWRARRPIRTRSPTPAWFAPDALPPVPPKLSIARALIDDFVRRHGGTVAP